MFLRTPTSSVANISCMVFLIQLEHPIPDLRLVHSRSIQLFLTPSYPLFLLLPLTLTLRSSKPQHTQLNELLQSFSLIPTPTNIRRTPPPHPPHRPQRLLLPLLPRPLPMLSRPLGRRSRRFSTKSTPPSPPPSSTPSSPSSPAPPSRIFPYTRPERGFTR